VTEAGGVLSTVQGGVFHTHSTSIVAAATPSLNAEIVQAIREITAPLEPLALG